VVLVAIVAVCSGSSLGGHLPYLWREWITSARPQGEIGVIVHAARLLDAAARLFADAIMMRAAANGGLSLRWFSLPPEHYNQIFLRATALS